MRGSRALWRRSKYGDEVVVEGGAWRWRHTTNMITVHGSVMQRFLRLDMQLRVGAGIAGRDAVTDVCLQDQVHPRRHFVNRIKEAR